jgi:hypothetical protein
LPAPAWPLRCGSRRVYLGLSGQLAVQRCDQPEPCKDAINSGPCKGCDQPGQAKMRYTYPCLDVWELVQV